MSSSNLNPTPPAWAAADAEDARHKAERADALARATPVHLVNVDLSFGAIFRICLLVAISQAIIAGAVLAVYLVAINAS